jgi:hypothetical protein
VVSAFYLVRFWSQSIIAIACLRTGAVKEDNGRMRAFFERCEQSAGEFDLSVVKADFFLFVGRQFLLHAPQNEMSRARFLLIKAPGVSSFDNLAFERAIEFIGLATERQFKMHTRRLTTDIGQLIAVNVKTLSLPKLTRNECSHSQPADAGGRI